MALSIYHRFNQDGWNTAIVGTADDDPTTGGRSSNWIPARHPGTLLGILFVTRPRRRKFVWHLDLLCGVALLQLTSTTTSTSLAYLALTLRDFVVSCELRSTE
jgi:hypothetical protein